MTNVNESELKKLTEELASIEIPKEALHQARVRAAHQHRLEKKRRRRLYSVASAAAIVMLLFVTSVRISPAFAQTVAKIPGFTALVDMIAYDKGIEDIVDNKYYEELGIVVTEGDYTLTLQGVVADHSGMIISYKLEAPFDLSTLQKNNVFVSQQGTPLSVATSFGGFPTDEVTVLEEKVEIVTNENLSYENKSFEFNLHLGDTAETKFMVPFTLTKQIEQPKVYEVNQSVTVDGQQIDIKQLKISPLRAEIRLALDEQNNMQLLDFTSVKLIDEKGEEWGKIRNGSLGFGTLRDGEVSLFIQSNYFRQPEELTLVMEKIEALPKGSDYIEVDFEQKKVLYVPSELDMDVQVTSGNSLTVIYPTESPNHTKQLLSGVFDSEGNELLYHSSDIMTHSSERQSYLESTYTFNFEKEVNKIRLYIISYPLYLDGKVEVNIQLD